jgi:hypothetical protein
MTVTSMPALRAVAAALTEPEILDALATLNPLAATGAELIAQAIATYDAAAPAVTLEKAFGLGCSHGGAGHWTTIERRQRRDTLLRSLAAERFPELSDFAAAREIHAIVAARRRRLPAAQRDELVEDILACGLGIPGVSGLRMILSVQEPLELTALNCIQTARHRES